MKKSFIIMILFNDLIHFNKLFLPTVIRMKRLQFLDFYIGLYCYLCVFYLCFVLAQLNKFLKMIDDAMKRNFC